MEMIDQLHYSNLADTPVTVNLQKNNALLKTYLGKPTIYKIYQNT